MTKKEQINKVSKDSSTLTILTNTPKRIPILGVGILCCFEYLEQGFGDLGGCTTMSWVCNQLP